MDMDVDTSVEEMEVDAWEMESAIEFCTSMKGFRKFATWKNEEDVVGAVVKPDKGRPWRPTTTHYVEQRRWRRMFFHPRQPRPAQERSVREGLRMQR